MKPPKYFLNLTFAALAMTASATTKNVAPLAHITASSEQPAHPASAVADGIIGIDGLGEWRSTSSMTSWGELHYPDLTLSWDEPRTIDRVVIYDTPSEAHHIAAVELHMSDGSVEYVNSIANDGSPREVRFSPRTVEWMKVVASDAQHTGVGLSEIEVFTSTGGTDDYVEKVNPYIETARGRYFFFATGSMPFGMISAAPLTRNKNQGGGGYNYNSTEILGFPQLHDWMIGAVVLMPAYGDVDPTLGEQGRKSQFRHESEIVRPGYHRVFLDDYRMWVENTCTDRVSMYRITPADSSRTTSMLLSLGGFVGTTTMINPRVRRTGPSSIAGEVTTVGRLWGGPDSVRVYFAMDFDRPIESLDGWNAKGVTPDVDTFADNATATKFFPSEYFSYWTAPTAGVRANFGHIKPGDRLHAKVAISYVSEANAQENIARELPQWDFDATHAAATATWHEQLGRIHVEGGTDAQQEKFYTDLWHVLLGRHKINDANGDYPDYTDGRRDGAFTRDVRFHARRLPMKADGTARFNMYNSDSFWLSQWNLNTLWGLAWPEVLDDFAACLVQYAENGGLIPRGPNLGGYSYIMTACPATSLIACAFQKGMLTKCAPAKAYRHIVRNHTGHGMLGSKEEIDFYERNGYFAGNAGVTLEAAFQDWTVGQMALKMGKKADYRRFNRRASGWTTLYDPEIGLIMPRRADGSWLHRNPLDGWGWVEANAWQATWSVSHDLDRLASLMGGADSLAARLNHAFEEGAKTDFTSDYNTGYISYANQPGLSNAHVFNRIGRGDLTQKWVRRVQAQTYGYNIPDRGYGCHDEDQGQMGATSALMSIGLFSVTGTAGVNPDYDVTSPIFDRVVIQLPKPYYPGKPLEIITDNCSADNYLIDSATFSGQPIDPMHAIITHDALRQGGLLHIALKSPITKPRP